MITSATWVDVTFGSQKFVAISSDVTTVRVSLDGEAWASNWMEDGIWSLPGVGEVAGKAKFYPMWQQAMSAFSFVGFFASAGPIVVTGDTAHGTWYQQEFLHMKAGGKQTITGRYEDDYVRKDGRWYFAKRVYAVLDRQVTE
jgi:ketosteroid isomerase-like protein